MSLADSVRLRTRVTSEVPNPRAREILDASVQHGLRHFVGQTVNEHVTLGSHFAVILEQL